MYLLLTSTAIMKGAGCKMPKLAVIADDLTGANDTGVQFSKFGLKTMVYFDSSEPAFVSEDSDVVVFDTNSRLSRKILPQAR